MSMSRVIPYGRVEESEFQTEVQFSSRVWNLGTPEFMYEFIYEKII